MKANKDSLVFRLQCDLYPHEVIFFVGPRPDTKVVSGICRRRGLWDGSGRPPDVGDGAAGTIEFKHGCFVWLDNEDIKDGPKFLALFNHELVHVLTHASGFMGIYMKESSDEFHAYYAGWITHQAMKHIYKRLCK